MWALGSLNCLLKLVLLSHQDSSNFEISLDSDTNEWHQNKQISNQKSLNLATTILFIPASLGRLNFRFDLHFAPTYSLSVSPSLSLSLLSPFALGAAQEPHNLKNSFRARPPPPNAMHERNQRRGERSEAGRPRFGGRARVLSRLARIVGFLEIFRENYTRQWHYASDNTNGGDVQETNNAARTLRGGKVVEGGRGRH